jgi:NADPH:quinone reductase-like Zn-dependent oxidoreductase
MKAAFIEQYGGPDILQYGEFPDPVAGPGEVLVDIITASVNAADWKVRLGEYPDIAAERAGEIVLFGLRKLFRVFGINTIGVEDP